MLIEFTIKNFSSIKDEIVFSMESTKYKADNLENNNFKLGTLELLKSAVIFGPNASGKSNILLAMKKMRDVIELSLSNKYRYSGISAFKFDVEAANEPTKFEVKFLYQNVIYRYGFKILNKIIQEEWLYYKKNEPRTRESQYFQRNLQNFTNYGEYKKEANLIKKENKTREDALYLVVVAEFNGHISQNIINWFETFNAFSSLHTDFLNYTLPKMRNEVDREKIVNFVQSADFGIQDIKENKLSIEDMSNKVDEKELPNDVLESIKKGEAVSIETYHPKYSNNKFVGLEPMSIGDESDGTQKFFEISGAIIEALDNGEILIIDELDNSFHTRMIEEIIKLFNSERNKKNAQLIFVSHNTNILTQSIFRRDQIWFTEKDIYGVTKLFSLIDFGTRKDTSLQKNYLAGKYGSIPVITKLEYSNG